MASSIFAKIQRSGSLKQLRCFPNKSHFAHSSSTPLSSPSLRFSGAYRSFSSHFAHSLVIQSNQLEGQDGDECQLVQTFDLWLLATCTECQRRGGSQGAKLVRAAETFAKVMKLQAPQCLVQLPSGVEKLIDY
ncbi:hypothetical protein Sjap_006175 [Stephania japonica]|uniref:Uncharacterized protein n=1 Tax=Stephania japonica TaxID=461633 RepID=A0AAP0PJH6_9MAGN